MRKLRPILCALCLALLIQLLVRAHRALPVDTGPLVAEKYAGWSGVLRLWVFEGWPCGGGSAIPWLNRCIERFERQHPGVYVQPTCVDAGALAAMNDSGIPKPDLALFPPGLLDSPEGLSPLAARGGIRAALSRCGVAGGTTYAVPVLAGGYGWAINAALLGEVPGSWRDIDVCPAVPEAEPWRRWDAALLALCAAQRPRGGGSAEATPGMGLDLGLAPSETPAPTPAPDVDAPACRLPAGFRFDADAWRRFINGEAAAMPVTQREIRRLQALSAQGRGPDWQVACGCGFTDQLLCLAIPEKPDGDPRLSLCVAFMDWLLSDECQGMANLAAAFSVTEAASGYPQGDPLGTLEAALRDDGLAAPGCFGSDWQTAAEDIVREFVEGGGDSRQLWAGLAGRMIQKANIPS